MFFAIDGSKITPPETFPLLGIRFEACTDNIRVGWERGYWPDGFVLEEGETETAFFKVGQIPATWCDEHGDPAFVGFRYRSYDDQIIDVFDEYPVAR